MPIDQSNSNQELSHMTPLRRRMIEDMQLHHLTDETQRTYLHHIQVLDLLAA
jgi:hypothetical protein